MGNSQSISLLTYGLDDTVLSSDHVNANFRNYMDNFTDIDYGLYVPLKFLSVYTCREL